jgi:hypothetical protein
VYYEDKNKMTIWRDKIITINNQRIKIAKRRTRHLTKIVIEFKCFEGVTFIPFMNTIIRDIIIYKFIIYLIST